LSNVSSKGSSSNCLIDKAILDFALFFVNAKYVQLLQKKFSFMTKQSNILFIPLLLRKEMFPQLEGKMMLC